MNKYLKKISLDLTRRCNLSCKYFCKGKAQDQDISREIIDKTLDELKSFDFISVFQFMGGEPFLCPELLEYCVDGIIKRKLNIGACTMFTNGTIKSKVVLNALIRFRDYLKENINAEYNIPHQLFIKFSKPMHDNSQYIDDVMEFYRKGLGKECIDLQDEFGEFEDANPHFSREIEGRGEENYREMLAAQNIPLHTVRRIHNKYHFVPHDSVLKTISVSTNGRVYVGASLSYTRIDQEDWICNIIDCSGDLFERIVEFGWAHPISDRANRVKERCLTAKWCYEHGIDLLEIGERQYKSYCLLGKLIDIQEQYAGKLHKQRPELIFLEVEFISSIQTMQYIKRNHLGDDILDAYADNATYFKEWKSEIDKLDDINPYLFEWGRIYIEFALWRATNRIKQGIDPIAVANSKT